MKGRGSNVLGIGDDRAVCALRKWIDGRVSQETHFDRLWTPIFAIVVWKNRARVIDGGEANGADGRILRVFGNSDGLIGKASLTDETDVL